MPISIGVDSALSLNLTQRLGLNCDADTWESLSSAQHEELIKLETDLRQIYGSAGVYSYRYNNLPDAHRNFPTMHWLHLYDQILGWGPGTPHRKQFHIRSTRKTFSSADIESMSENYRVSYLVSGANRADTDNLNLMFRVVSVTRGMEAVDKIANNTKHGADCIDLRNTAMACTIDSRHKLAVILNRTDGTYDIVTNRPLDQFWHRLLPSLLLSEPQLAEVSNAPYDEYTPLSRMRTFCRMLYENRVEEYMAYLHKIAEAGANARQQLLFNQLDSIKTTLSQREIKQLQSNIRGCDGKLNEYYNVIETELSTREIYCQRLTGLLTSQEANSEQLTAAFQFIKDHPEIIELKSIDNNILILDITTPISNWRIKDAAMWFKRREENYVNRNHRTATAFKACFVDESFEMITKTRVAFNLTPTQGGVTVNGSNQWNESTTTMQNSHVGRYNCFSNYKAAIQKAMQTSDFYRALMLIIQACGTYTFTDSTVVNNLCRNMGYCEGPVYLNKATDKLCTITELCDIVNQSAPETDETATTTVNEED